jgi:hypothetical protein
MKKIVLAFLLIISLFSTTNAYNNTFRTCNDTIEKKSYDYYADWTFVKKYAFDQNSRNKLKVCFYNDHGRKTVLDNGEYKIIKKIVWNKINFEKIFCDNWITRSIFTWKKTVKMSCNFTVNNKRFTLNDWKTKIVKTRYGTKTISQKFKCNNGKVTKIAEWVGLESEKKSCSFIYNWKNYKLDHSAYTTIKSYEHDHLVYRKYVCDNGKVKDYSLWRNYNNELTKNCRFIYRGKYYDLQDNGIKVFNTTIYTNWVKKTFTRKYYCEHWIAKIH